MRRRAALTAFSWVAGGGLVSGCGATDVAARSPDRLALGPAKAHALTPTDLPGFQLSEELVPTLVSTGLEDPYGRLGSYSVTFVPAFAEGQAGDVISSVNTYAGSAYARAAFEAWQAAVPRQYRPGPLDVGLPLGDSATYLRDGAALIGFRVRNVMGSVRAPQERAVQLARLMIARVNSAAR